MADAACVQAQQLIAKQRWPKGLFQGEQQLDPAQQQQQQGPSLVGTGKEPKAWKKLYGSGEPKP